MNTSFFMKHPMNVAMIDGSLPPFDPGVYNTPYIMLAKSGKEPTEEQVERIKSDLIAYCESVDDDEQFKKDVSGIERTWPEMKIRFAKSIGLTQLMLDYGCRSRYFYSYLFFTGRKLFSVALEMKDGYGVPVSFENKFEEIPKEDWSYIVAVQEPSHVARRVTDGAIQARLRSASKIFEVGGALLPAYRRYDYPLGKLSQKIVACDFDKESYDFLPALFPNGLGGCGIDYIIGDALQVMDCQVHFAQYDVVRMTGVLSYYPKTDEKLNFIRKAEQLLEGDDSVIFCDLQTMGGEQIRSSLVRSALINLWPMDPTDPHKLTPSSSVQAAVEEMSGICKKLGLKMVYRADFCNGNPACVTQAAASQKCVMFAIGRRNITEAEVFDDVPELGM